MMAFRYFRCSFFGLIVFSLIFPIAKEAPTIDVPPGTEAIIGEYGNLGNPINDRAKGFLLQGMVKSAITNYGNFISGDEYPSGVWKDYGYLYDVSMLAGVPGQKYSNVFKWYKVSEAPISSLSDADSEAPSDSWDQELQTGDCELSGTCSWADEGIAVFCSSEAYDAWCGDDDCGTCQTLISIDDECSLFADQDSCESEFLSNGVSERCKWNSVDEACDKNWDCKELGDAASCFNEELEMGCGWVNDGTGGEFVDVLFDHRNDQGTLGRNVTSATKADHFEMYGPKQWSISTEYEPNVVCLSVAYDQDEIDNPNKTNARIGLVYPWAKRASLDRRSDFDFYNYGLDANAWTEDDDYVYYGANVAESWFTRIDGAPNTNWQPTYNARNYTHSLNVKSGDLFGSTPYASSTSTEPLLAHSAYSSTWPQAWNPDTGEFTTFWPGSYAQVFDCSLPDCLDCSKKHDECWYIPDEEGDRRFISENDVYMEFDDRWAHQGNRIKVDTDTGYEQSGYPMGIQVKATAHSYGVAYAEDIMFVTVKVFNESDEMVMPDGTLLNDGEGFDYRDMSFGFYMDADVLMGDINGYSQSYHTPADDFMEYEKYTIEIPSTEGDGATDRMNISMALIGDYDGYSGGGLSGYSMDDPTSDPGTDFGIVAVQMLDSPLAKEDIDIGNDGTIDIYAGEKLKMTDWHWFDWMGRPGVVGSSDIGGGSAGSPRSANQEEIQYKIMVGDTTNLSDSEKLRFFHADPSLDELDPDFNPHFDNVEDLRLTSFFDNDEDGLDCVLMMTSGPFDLNVGDETFFSFCIIFGQNKQDLLSNAEFAQIMYNNRYQGYSPPKRPKVVASYDHGQIKLHWNNDSEFDKDVVTGYSDFEGYKIYKSTDGGATWGGPEDKIYDNSGIQRGWRPLAQYDLTKDEDENYCVSIEQVFENGDVACRSFEGFESNVRGMDISGPDPITPWFTLGYNTGFDNPEPLTDEDGDNLWDEGEDFEDVNQNGIWDNAILTDEPYIDSDGNEYQYTFVDNDVDDGTVYTYSVTAYDMGIAPPFANEFVVSGDSSSNFVEESVANSSNPLGFSNPSGYEFVEVSRGTTVLEDNFIQVVAGYRGDFSVDDVIVYPNPYIGSSGFNAANEYTRLIRFSRVPYDPDTNTGANITIYTLNGEKVFSWNVADVLEEEQCVTCRQGNDGYSSWWDLRSVNNQEVAPGLYLYRVEYNGQSSVGKFAIVR